MYKNLDYSSPGLDPETYHSPQGQGQETPLTPIRVNLTQCYTWWRYERPLQASFFLRENCGYRLGSSTLIRHCI